jgi:hypothetical protein
LTQVCWYRIQKPFGQLPHHLGYQSLKGDLDAWFRPAVKVTKEEYSEYLLVYTDDILAIGLDPKDVLTA